MINITWDKNESHILLLEYRNKQDNHAMESHIETIRYALEMATELFVAIVDYPEIDGNHKGLFDLIVFAKECVKSPLYSGHLVIVSHSNQGHLVVPQLSNFTKQMQLPQSRRLKWTFAPNLDYARSSANQSIEALKSISNSDNKTQ